MFPKLMAGGLFCEFYPALLGSSKLLPPRAGWACDSLSEAYEDEAPVDSIFK